RRFAFFLQAEDGIRDFHVTGVQTCALPICAAGAPGGGGGRGVSHEGRERGPEAAADTSEGDARERALAAAATPPEGDPAERVRPAAAGEPPEGFERLRADGDFLATCLGDVLREQEGDRLLAT